MKRLVEDAARQARVATRGGNEESRRGMSGAQAAGARSHPAAARSRHYVPGAVGAGGERHVRRRGAVGEPRHRASAASAGAIGVIVATTPRSRAGPIIRDGEKHLRAQDARARTTACIYLVDSAARSCRCRTRSFRRATFRPHLLQPAAHVGGRHSADRACWDRARRRRLCAAMSARASSCATRAPSSWAAAAREGGDR